MQHLAFLALDLANERAHEADRNRLAAIARAEAADQTDLAAPRPRHGLRLHHAAVRRGPPVASTGTSPTISSAH